MAELIFLGTGAANYKLEEKDADFRRNSSVLIDKKLLIDPGPHIFDYIESFGCEDLFDKLETILITHSHGDHFSPESVYRLAENRKITIACDGHKKEILGNHKNIEYTELNPYKDYSINGYTITPILANHLIVSQGNHHAFHFIIKDSHGKTLFYGLDGSWFLKPSWMRMCEEKYDIMVLEVTVGEINDGRIFEHNSIPMCRDMVQQIRSKNLLASDGRIIASHLAKGLIPPHKEAEKIFGSFGVETAYDSMKIIY